MDSLIFCEATLPPFWTRFIFVPIAFYCSSNTCEGSADITACVFILPHSFISDNNLKTEKFLNFDPIFHHQLRPLGSPDTQAPLSMHGQGGEGEEGEGADHLLTRCGPPKSQ